MNENGQKLSYREILNMKRSYSSGSKQVRMLQKYGPKSTKATFDDSNIYNEEKATKERTDMPENQSVPDIQSDNIAETEQLDPVPARDINPVKEFEKIFAKYLS